jgi:hypothetical protein
VREGEPMFKSRPRKYGIFCIMFNNLNASSHSTLGHYCETIMSNRAVNPYGEGKSFRQIALVRDEEKRVLLVPIQKIAPHEIQRPQASQSQWERQDSASRYQSEWS